MKQSSAENMFASLRRKLFGCLLAAVLLIIAVKVSHAISLILTLYLYIYIYFY